MDRETNYLFNLTLDIVILVLYTLQVLILSKYLKSVDRDGLICIFSYMFAFIFKLVGTLIAFHGERIQMRIAYIVH